MRKALIIVDPQYDFINGTLPVPGAEGAMEALAEYAAEHAGEYAMAVITVDWHGPGHCSFAENGGPWPRHCVRHSHGAAVYEPLLRACEAYPLVILEKGDDDSREEYSICGNARGARALDLLLRSGGIEAIDICGLAGDVCVANTKADLERLYPGIPVGLLAEFSPCISN